MLNLRRKPAIKNNYLYKLENKDGKVNKRLMANFKHWKLRFFSGVMISLFVISLAPFYAYPQRNPPEIWDIKPRQLTKEKKELKPK